MQLSYARRLDAFCTLSLDEVIVAPENTELVEAYQYTTTDGETVKYYFDVTLEEASE